ncbi:hypothetical protein FD754_014954 [Muntiacus muntjak]|uniref:FAD dependent oxidoreductase domain-containing protein n=1 Tax=Muntiacus muntjak TaxID=9888 RepID=A0A5N3VLE7_MUNMU|nr:hypothetical protein FD754_014954 [Muntiacus muntjak]
MTKLDSVLKSRDITLPTKVHLVKAMVFPVLYCRGEKKTTQGLSIIPKPSEGFDATFSYTRTGSIFLAQTQDRLISLKRISSRLNVIGIPCEIVSPRRVAELHPLLNMHDLVGAMHVPEDAVVSSADVALTLASAASQNGLEKLQGWHRPWGFGAQRGSRPGVGMNEGKADPWCCPLWMNWVWAYELGLCSEEPVSIPLHACEHFYLLTRPWETPLPSSTPSEDLRLFLLLSPRPCSKNWKPIFTKVKNQLEIQNLWKAWDHSGISLLRRMPQLETLEIVKLVNCPETFTPDMRCIMGKSPLVRGYFVLVGMNSAGLSLGGGAGKVEWQGHGARTHRGALAPQDSLPGLVTCRLSPTQLCLRPRACRRNNFQDECKVPEGKYVSFRALKKISDAPRILISCTLHINLEFPLDS